MTFISVSFRTEDTEGASRACWGSWSRETVPPLSAFPSDGFTWAPPHFWNQPVFRNTDGSPSQCPLSQKCPCLESLGKAWHPQYHKASGTEAKHTQTRGKIKLSFSVTTGSINLLKASFIKCYFSWNCPSRSSTQWAQHWPSKTGLGAQRAQGRCCWINLPQCH